MKIKICGIKTVEDVQAANDVKPDYIGFVFAPGAHQVTPSIAAYLKTKLSGEIKTVGVFVDEDPQAIIRLYDRGVIELAQLHGHENEDTIHLLKNAGVPVIKAVRVKTAADLTDAKTLTPDYFLLDAYDEARAGGTGASFDWRMIGDFAQDMNKPVFLAGGIDEANINEALTLPVCAIDVSSGTETGGRKDKAKMNALTRRVHAHA